MSVAVAVEPEQEVGLETQVEQQLGARQSAPMVATNRLGRKGRTLPEKMETSMGLAHRKLALADERWRAKLSDEAPACDEGMGRIERDLLEGTLSLQAAALAKRIQKIANDTPPNCPICGSPLKGAQWYETTVFSRFGEVSFSRVRGYCPKCKKHFAPADHVLKLPADGKNSPEMSEQMQLMGAVVPPAQAERLCKKIYGFEVDANRINRELERAGKIEKREREQRDEQALDTQGRWEVTERVRPDLPKKFVLCIQYDGFLVRERDDWGQTKPMRERGEEVKRWHETKAATIFLLEDRVECGDQSPRPVILRRTFLATRAEAHEFSRQLYAEAVHQGLLLADHVYIVADGAAWIWNVARDRFPWAEGTLDFYHAAQHLETLSRALYGEGEQASRWAKRQRKRLLEDDSDKFLDTIEQLARVIDQTEPTQCYADDETVVGQWEYFNNHRAHLDYADKSARGLPIGSGCIESTCKQYQLRVKRMGQFWLQKNLEGMLLLYSKHLSFLWN